MDILGSSYLLIICGSYRVNIVRRWNEDHAVVISF